METGFFGGDTRWESSTLKSYAQQLKVLLLKDCFPRLTVLKTNFISPQTSGSQNLGSVSDLIPQVRGVEAVACWKAWLENNADFCLLGYTAWIIITYTYKILDRPVGILAIFVRTGNA